MLVRDGNGLFEGGGGGGIKVVRGGGGAVYGCGLDCFRDLEGKGGRHCGRLLGGLVIELEVEARSLMSTIMS